MDTIKKVTKAEDIALVSQMAYRIWTHHYLPIIGEQQVSYMLERFQSEQAIKEQIGSGHEYYLFVHQETPKGYIGLIPHEPKSKMMISKIYVEASARGSGYGAKMLDFTLELSKEQEYQAVWLTVNRHNKKSIAWYQKRGFVIIDEVLKDIGNGFVMDDFVMEHRL